MKRLFFLVIIIALPVIAFFQYLDHSKFDSPNDYEYVVNDSIDLNYHDPLVVQSYYENALKIGTFSRQKWLNDGIDVRYPDESKNGGVEAAQLYTQMISSTKYLEGLLIYSKNLKSKGFNNNEIQVIIEEGISPEYYVYTTNKGLKGIKHGDQGLGVWELQSLLLVEGYEIPHDGVFGDETEEALKQIQLGQGIMPSGIVDEETIKVLVETNMTD